MVKRDLWGSDADGTTIVTGQRADRVDSEKTKASAGCRFATGYFSASTGCESSNVSGSEGSDFPDARVDCDADSRYLCTQ